jgi:peptidyl-prolyl cis-trans isomerase C/foldase protein PrsA
VSANRCLLFLLLAAACHRPKQAEEDTSVIATVNGEIIARTLFEQELEREVDLAAQVAGEPKQLEPIKQQLLKTLIERALLLQAAKAMNVSLTPEEVDRGVMRISADYPDERFGEALAQGQMTLADLKQKTAALLTTERLFQEQVYARVAVTEGEIRSYYETHRDEFREPEQVHAAQIVVKGLEDAKRVQQQLRAGKKFGDLARKYSLSPDAKVGGDLGFFPRGVMPPQFDEVAFKLGVNQVSDIVTTEYGFHLFKVLEKRAPRAGELPEARTRIHEKLLKEKREQAQREYLQSLWRSAKIHINERALEAIVVKPRSTGARTAEP